MKIFLTLLACAWSASGIDMNPYADSIKKANAPLKRSVAGRVYDIGALIDWDIEDKALRDTSPQLRKALPQQFWDWQELSGDAVARTNGMTYMRCSYQPRGTKRAQLVFVALKNYPKDVKAGQQFYCYAYNLKYSRTDYVNQVPITCMAFDFGTPAK